jgi:futalosine hydrolase
VSRILVLTAVPAEADALLAGLPETGPAAISPTAVGPYPARRARTWAGEVVVLAGGVGPARAAACAGTAVPLERPDLVLCAGLAGGFAGRAGIGDVVVADAVVHADLGADSPSGFRSIADLGLGEAVIRLPGSVVAAAAARTGAVVGPVLTVSTVTGTDARAAELARRHRPVAEAMEGAGVLAAALAHGVPFGEVRAVSNAVGRRDRASWDLPGALDALGRAFARLLAEPFPVPGQERALTASGAPVTQQEGVVTAAGASPERGGPTATARDGVVSDAAANPERGRRTATAREEL